MCPPDPLSDIVSLLVLKKVAWSQLEAGGEWALRFPATAVLKFIKVESGGCYAFHGGGGGLRLARGDMLLLLNAQEYVIASRSGVTPLYGPPLFTVPDQPIVRMNGNETVLRSVHYTLASDNLNLLLRLLPGFFLIPATNASSAPLRRCADQLLEELADSRYGSAMMVKHLCEMLLMQTVRAFVASSPGNLPGWLGGLADAHVGRALAIMHERLGETFTLESLAAEVGISRSSLALRFRRKVGMPPLGYLTWWRMQRARRSLDTCVQPLATLSRNLGYSSESAFGAAFKRQFGISPGQYARGISKQEDSPGEIPN